MHGVRRVYLNDNSTARETTMQHSSTQKWNENFAINKTHLICCRTLNKTQNFEMNIYI